jgi:uncharacterized protein
MSDLPREKKLIIEFCANMDPGPLTEAERREYERHFAHFLTLARQGDAKQQYDVGTKYLAGIWVKADPEQGAYWMTLSATNGDVDAQEALAGLYCAGVGVEQNPVKAARWMSMAAEAEALQPSST